MMAIYDRLIVITVLGKIRIYIGAFTDQKINKSDASIDLGLDQHEKVTASCISVDKKFLAVSTNRHNNSGSYENSIRLYEIVTTTKLKLLAKFHDTPTKEANSFVLHMQISNFINGYPLITCMVHDHPHEFASFIFHQHELKRFTVPYPITKGNISCVRATSDGYWITSVDGNLSKLELILL